MNESNNLPAVLAAVQATTSDPDLQRLLSSSNTIEQQAVLRALRSAYEAGQESSDQRTGKLMARIFGGFVGVTPGIDMGWNSDDRSPRKRLRDMVKMLAKSGTEKL